MTRGIWVLVGWVCLGPAACSAKTDDTGGETNWVRCAEDSDCSVGESCRAEVCRPVSDASAEPEPETSVRDAINPTGDCVATSDGGRLEHSPDETDVYLPDCQLGLARSYYRVFLRTDDTAYMIPHLAIEEPTFREVCRNTDHRLREVLDRYDLCQNEVFSSAQTERFQAMAPADALQIAHHLHEHLVFFATENGVTPYPYTEDFLEACKTDQAFRNGPVGERCDHEIEFENRDRADDVGLPFTGQQGMAVADELNELYGIQGQLLCTRLGKKAALAFELGLEGAPACTNDADCDVSYGPSCTANCGVAINQSDAAGVAAAEVAAEAICGNFERARCEPVLALPCEEPWTPICVDGHCKG